MNNNKPYAYPSVASAQRGAVLIVVLLFLMLIMLVGVIAVRNSSTDLKLATSDQINTVLLQSSDSVNNKIEMSVNGDPISNEHKQIMSFTGIFGHYILNDSAENDIIDFCYRPRVGFFNINNAAIRRNTGKLVTNTEGYCDPKVTGDYTSARNTTMTQVMIKNVNKAAGARAFGHMTLGSDTEAKTTKMHTFNIYSTSVLPSYGNAKTDNIQDCFQKDASATEGGVAECMTKNNVPNKMLVEQVDVANVQSGEFCNFFGKDTKGNSSSQLCKDS
ncbi:pilus assembly protein PilX [Psychrobacter frigidicola]|uniref:Pilus assembly protein PilX n=1 Tax=Psychrobacter frigidicola TaxID=45611 RepID=A0A5C7A5C1_9GAMM|nr:pilus assembly PilX N-terminal domain-containing protein [Psychrobacter frigidicola]TXD97013.1 pilus assembly protein PilX [Psychrobacter frigidicola]